MEARDVDTRARVLRAAVDCILEDGFYRASSNRIAARAGVTWGVIQHHFGTRERLMFAVFEASVAELVAILRAAEVAGATFEDRLGSFADVVWRFYRRPEFLAYMQVGLNMSHDPSTAADTLGTMRSMHDEIASLLDGLVAATVGDREVPDGFAASLFEILRGLAIGLEMTDAFPGQRPETRTGRDPECEILVAALSALVR